MDRRTVVIGSINYDIIIKQDRLPKIGETISANSVSMSGGGKGANQAVQCAKLGLDTHMIGKVGNDHFGDELLNGLEKYHVHTNFIKKADTNSGLGFVNSFPDGRLLSTIEKGANYKLQIKDIQDAVSIIKEASIVVIQLEIPIKVAEYAIQLGKKHGCYIILNAAPSVPISADVLKLVDCFVVNEAEASYYAGTEIETAEQALAASDLLQNMVAHLVCITLGEKGSVLFDGKEKQYFPAEKVDVIETTGAGDSYIGGIAYSVLNNFLINEMGKFASKVSSKTVTNIGAHEAMPSLEEVIM
ncbi:ribokinase [Gracilibacillus massiliensis]|uniref:ribokinase n=1 Tax=Gracilibacillus massiliensis TaxID=1564956 RepID=UPI00071D5A5C|nr:ribokinase [Gracilibacillus massiliensis]